jgi:hypothetical protein
MEIVDHTHISAKIMRRTAAFLTAYLISEIKVNKIKDETGKNG